MPEKPYDREAAVAYAHRWAYDRNPAFFNFDDIGGNCTNFASQCIFAGSGVMNFTPVFGWFYLGVNDRSASWTGVEYLYNFLLSNSGPGPYAAEVPMSEVMPGDIAQMRFREPVRFQHSPVVVEITGPPSPSTILVAANSFNVDCRRIETYFYSAVRFLHILGVRT